MKKEYQIFERIQQNNFSFWFPKVEHCGIRVPRSIIIPVGDEMIHHFCMEQSGDYEAILCFVKNNVEPAVKEAKFGLCFVKNGTFSNKFDASHSCLPQPGSLTEAIININYGALCTGAGGEGEIVIRERIPHDARVTPCIYHGLPFRTEFRVFYDFDDQQVIFVANYWDYDYVYPHLHDVTDRIIFEHQREKMESKFEALKDKAAQTVAEAMKNVSGLDGAWSVDLLLDEKDEFWLIDMAVAEQSAYWDRRPGYTPPAEPKRTPVCLEKNTDEAVAEKI